MHFNTKCKQGLKTQLQLEIPRLFIVHLYLQTFISIIIKFCTMIFLMHLLVNKDIVFLVLSTHTSTFNEQINYM